MDYNYLLCYGKCFYNVLNCNIVTMYKMHDCINAYSKWQLKRRGHLFKSKSFWVSLYLNWALHQNWVLIRKKKSKSNKKCQVKLFSQKSQNIYQLSFQNTSKSFNGCLNGPLRLEEIFPQRLRACLFENEMIIRKSAKIRKSARILYSSTRIQSSAKIFDFW